MFARLYDPDRPEFDDGTVDIGDVIAEIMAGIDWTNVACGYGIAAERWFDTLETHYPI